MCQEACLKVLQRQPDENHELNQKGRDLFWPFLYLDFAESQNNDPFFFNADATGLSWTGPIIILWSWVF